MNQDEKVLSCKELINAPSGTLFQHVTERSFLTSLFIKLEDQLDSEGLMTIAGVIDPKNRVFLVDPSFGQEDPKFRVFTSEDIDALLEKLVYIQSCREKAQDNQTSYSLQGRDHAKTAVH